MLPSLNLDLPEPEWLTLLKAERESGKSVSQIAREVQMARPSVSMLIAGTYPAQSLDLVAKKHGAKIVKLYRNEVLCPHLRRGLSSEQCQDFASRPMSISNPDRLAHWDACRNCPRNPLKETEND